MIYQYLGQWLLEKQLISPQQLQEATDLQNKTNQPLGAIAIEIGLLTHASVTEINKEQQRTDRQFGEIAQQLYLLKASQVDGLLVEQERRRIYLGEALAILGFIEREVLGKEIIAHRRYQQQHMFALNNTLESLPHSGIIKTYIDSTVKLFSRIVHENFMIDSVSTRTVSSDETLHRFQLKIDGDNPFNLMMSMPETFTLKIESKLYQQECTIFSESSLRATQELLNIISSNARLKTRKKDITLNPSPPEILEDSASLNEVAQTITTCMVSPSQRLELQLTFH